jgi:hypothetical protein
METIFYYREKKSDRTRDPLREIKNIAELAELLKLYQATIELACLQGYDGWLATDFEEWYLDVNEHLPKKTLTGGIYCYQTPREWLEGCIEKTSRPRGHDLSPRQCEGITVLSQQFASTFHTPVIKFKNKNHVVDKTLPNMFEVL